MKQRSGRIGLGLTILAAFSCLFAASALAATIIGTNGKDKLNGSSDADTIRRQGRQGPHQRPRR